MEKYYWFSAKKHQHDIDFRRNRLFNEICDMEYNGKKVSDKMYKLLDDLDELREWLCWGANGAIKIPGHLYQLAIDSVAWAQAIR